MGEPITSWWKRVSIGKQLIGNGISSEAYLVRDKNTLYIVRLTDVSSLMQKKIIEHEIDIYNHILQYPTYTNYISELLFTYCPPKFAADHYAFFIFRFKMGMPLDNFISFFKEKRLHIKKETAELWYKQMHETVAFLKNIYIVHRDIKPANMFMDSESNRLLLFDFDTACFVGDDCRTTDFRGTRAYSTENAKRLLNQVGFPTPYQYTHKDDEYAVKILFEQDIYPIVEVTGPLD